MSDDRAYRQLWRIVDGAVFDALYTHQDYLTDKGRIAARNSIVKRVTGSVHGYVEQSTKSRSKGGLAADRVQAKPRLFPRGAFFAASKWRVVATAIRQLFRRHP